MVNLVELTKLLSSAVLDQRLRNLRPARFGSRAVDERVDPAVAVDAARLVSHERRDLRERFDRSAGLFVGERADGALPGLCGLTERHAGNADPRANKHGDGASGADPTPMGLLRHIRPPLRLTGLGASALSARATRKFNRPVGTGDYFLRTTGSPAKSDLIRFRQELQ